MSLLSLALLAGPLSAVAQTTSVHHHHHVGRQTATEARETVEDRIKTLHVSLMITPEEETKWVAVAQVMRDNEAGMQRLVEERRANGTHELTAVEDLKTYEHFTQAHVDGLKNLISTFEILYAAMPTAQQTVADTVFRHVGAHQHSLKS